MLIAITANDEVNSLAAKEFTHIFGSANVWQIAPDDDGTHHTTAVSASHRGRICFPNRPNHMDLEEFVEDGAVVKKTTLSEQFTYDDFIDLYFDNSIILFLYSGEKGLRPAADEMRDPGPGTSIYCLTTPTEIPE